MGNPDLVIIFNNGEVGFLIKGVEYSDRAVAISIGIEKWKKYTDNHNFSELKSIVICELHL